jgi:hypothetical protein
LIFIRAFCVENCQLALVWLALRYCSQCSDIRWAAQPSIRVPAMRVVFWRECYAEAFTNGRGDASYVWEILAPLMPKPGEDRSSVSDIFGSVYAQCIELMAGRMLLSDSEPVPPVDDLRQARELAMLIDTSEDAVGTFIAHCDVAARDLLLPYGDVVMTLSIVLRIKRTLDSDEIDKIISDLQALKEQAIEHRWRANRRK